MSTDTVNFELNGEPSSIALNTSVTDLIASLELQGKRIAVEINGEIIPKGEHAEVTINPDDAVEVVFAIGGG